jgi:hypothetical protein
VRERWQWLFGSATVSLVGVAWLCARLGLPADVWATFGQVGMILCAITALAAALTSYPKKWPAAVALLCAAPTAQNIVLAFPSTMQAIIYFGMPYLCYVAGAIGAAAAALAILVMRPPAPPADDDIVARARIVR